jgi:P27 family predicted phage terminase small subunit
MGRSKRASAPSRAAKPRLTAAELAPRILELLPGKQSQIAQALGRAPSDGTVRRALRGLAGTGAARRGDRGVWERCQELPTLATPEDFDQEARALHARTLRALQEQGTWRDHDADLLRRYVQREQDAREYRSALREDGRFIRSRGRIYAHPAIDKERDALRDVQALADALVLTPDARRRHGRDGDSGGEDGDEFEDF